MTMPGHAQTRIALLCPTQADGPAGTGEMQVIVTSANRALPTLLLLVCGASPAFSQAVAPTTGAPNAGPTNSETPGASPSAIVPSPGATPNTKPPSAWADRLSIGAQLDGGIIANPARPADGQNFGDIYTDHANQAQLNQLLITATRTTDPNATGYDVGFTLQTLYGSDARAEHFLGQFDRLITSRYQFDIVQANILLHLPWFTAGGVDAKLGEFQSIMGLETLDPSTNPFYSHSFIYNWGVTFENTGIVTTTHINPTVDLYLGIDSGNTTTLGAGDNNGAPAGYVGLGLNNLFNNKVTVLGTAHIGPEQSTRVDPNANGDERYYADILTTWKVNDKLTSNTELNYVKDEFYRSEAYGFAQYFAYPLTPTLTLNTRGEVWRANSSSFVANYPNNLGFVQAEAGLFTPAIVAPPTTYSELTIGVTYKPDVPKAIKVLLVRPEIRYERSLNGTTPFNAGRDNDAFLFGGDVVLGF